MQNADAGSIKKAAADLGMRSLRDDGIVKVKSGLTSFDEVLRVTQVEGVEA
jgi:type II secretory ATPase GspE/PulE/Tfp pilus assembly ATPase PilB-like protein